MAMQNKAFISALIQNKYAINMHANKQQVNGEYVFPNLECYWISIINEVVATYLTGACDLCFQPVQKVICPLTVGLAFWN